MPAAMLLSSLIPPISNGIKAPPETAIIISPEISLLLAGNFSTAIEKTRGKRYTLDYGEDSVSDINEQRLIILYMCEKLPKEYRKSFVEKCPFMFVHADNVRAICKLFGFEEPMWFKEKYGHLYAKK